MDDREILRELGRRIAEIAALPRQRETIGRWKALNGLRPERPMVLIDQLPWHELDVDGLLELRCRDEFCRSIERDLRRKLYQWKHLPADMVIEPYVDVPKVVTGVDDFGVTPQETTLALDTANDVISHHYDDMLATEADVERINTRPVVRLDAAATALREAWANDIFAGVLPVRMVGVGPLFFRPWDLISQWRGVMPPLTDLMDRPEFIHRTLGRISEGYHAMLDQLEEQGLLSAVNDLVHCTGAWTDELPAADFDPARPRARDTWTAGMAQMFSTVSPAMHEEFEIEYAKGWYERFGLGYYGCCEPLDRKIGIIRKLPHVRKVSMSPWVDVERGAAAIGGDYVFSRKPSPAFLAVDSFEEDAVRKDLKNTLESCRRHGCPVELILKDVSTVRYDPKRLWRWAEIARELVEG